MGKLQGIHPRRRARAAPRPAARAFTIRGFTIIEMMIVLSVMALLLVLALPNVRDTLARNQLLGQTNELAAALQLARNEAVTRGLSAGVCPSSNGSTCGSATDWSAFLLVIADTNLDGAIGAGDTTLRVYSSHQNRVTVTAGGSTGVLFNNSGFRLGGDAQFQFCHESLAENNRCRQLTVRPSGAVNVQTVIVSAS